jgi:hypothetical protein
MRSELEMGSRIFLVAGMKRKPVLLGRARIAYEIDGRWYWSDGTAVDGSAMRWEAREKASEET